MIKKKTLELGRRGEDAAAQWLSEQGYNILARNWRFGRAEIDLIIEDAAHNIIFIEVKTRSDNTFSQPEAAVSARKQQRIYEAALAFLHHIGHDWGFRFDILSILYKDEKFFIQHIQDAFFPAL